MASVSQQTSVGFFRRGLAAIKAGVREFSAGANPATQAEIERMFSMFMGIPTWSGQEITPLKAMQTSAVFGCVRVLSSSIAGLPLGVYRRTMEAGKKRKELANDHPLFALLHDEPNPEQTSFEWLETVVAHMCLRGNSYHFIEASQSGWPVAIWPIHPDVVTVRRNPGSMAIVYDVRLANGKSETYAESEILHFKGLSYDGLTGMNPMELHREQIGATRAADEYSGRFFANDGRPPGILRTDQVIGQTFEQGQEMKGKISEDWKAKTTGENRHTPPVVDRGLDWKTIGVAPEDSQMLETRRYNVADIARIYGVPLMLLAETEKSTSWGAGIEQQLVAFVTYSLRSWLVRLERSMRRALMTPTEKKEYFIEFNVSGLLRGDINSRYSAYNVGRNGGWLSVNEIRDLENLNPIEGGDIYLQPLNMDPVGSSRDKSIDGVNDATPAAGALASAYGRLLGSMKGNGASHE